MWSISAPSAPVNVVRGERLADRPGEANELLEMGAVEGVGVMPDQKKPVATPGDVAGHLAVSGHLHFDRGGPSVAGYVFDGDRAVFVQRGSHDAYRGFDAMVSGFDPAQISERHHHADGAVPAHSQASAVVEENYAGDAVRMAGSQSSAPTITSELRGSVTRARRNAS